MESRTKKTREQLLRAAKQADGDTFVQEFFPRLVAQLYLENLHHGHLR